MTKKLFVGNLPDGCTKEELGDLFKKYGKVVEYDVIQNKNYGFVHMSSDHEAQDAVTQLDSSQFLGNLIKVQFSTTDVHRSPGIGSKGECFKCGSKGHLSRDCDRVSGSRGRGRDGRGGRDYQRSRGPPYQNGYREDRGRPMRRDPPRGYRDTGYADSFSYREERGVRRLPPRDLSDRKYLDDPYSRRMPLSAREYELLYRARSRSPVRGIDDYRRSLYSSRSDVYDRLYSSRSHSYYDMPPRSRVSGGSRAPLPRYR